MMKAHKPLILIIDDEESLRDGCRQASERTGTKFQLQGRGNSLQNRSYTERSVRHLPRSFNPDQSNKNIVEKPVNFK